MTWQTILKYASNPKYVDLKRRLEALSPIDDKNESRAVRLEEKYYLDTGDEDSLLMLEYYIDRIERKRGYKK